MEPRWKQSSPRSWSQAKPVRVNRFLTPSRPQPPAHAVRVIRKACCRQRTGPAGRPTRNDRPGLMRAGLEPVGIGRSSSGRLQAAAPASGGGPGRWPAGRPNRSRLEDVPVRLEPVRRSRETTAGRDRPSCRSCRRRSIQPVRRPRSRPRATSKSNRKGRRTAAPRRFSRRQSSIMPRYNATVTLKPYFIETAIESTRVQFHRPDRTSRRRGNSMSARKPGQGDCPADAFGSVRIQSAAKDAWQKCGNGSQMLFSSRLSRGLAAVTAEFGKGPALGFWKDRWLTVIVHFGVHSTRHLSAAFTRDIVFETGCSMWGSFSLAQRAGETERATLRA